MKYPKGTKLAFSVEVDEVIDTETKLIRMFGEKFETCQHIGREYFAGDINLMIKTVLENATLATSDFNQIICAPSIAVMQFVDENREQYDERIVKSTDVYTSFLEWVKKRNYSVSISNNRFTSELKKNFNVVQRVYKFTDGINRGFDFPKLQINNESIPLQPMFESIPLQPMFEYISLQPMIRVKHSKILEKKAPYMVPVLEKYICPRCGYSSNHRTSIHLHFKRKKVCILKEDGMSILTDEVKQMVFDGVFRKYVPKVKYL